MLMAHQNFSPLAKVNLGPAISALYPSVQDGKGWEGAKPPPCPLLHQNPP